ncbi:hypothetical protein BGZ65_010571, partial [Modicella reniformis]
MVQAIREDQVEQSGRLMWCLQELKDSLAKITELTMLKFGISVAGVVVQAVSRLIDVIPAVSDLVRAGDIKKIKMAEKTIQQLRSTIVPRMDQVIEYLEKASVEEVRARDGIIEQI